VARTTKRQQQAGPRRTSITEDPTTWARSYQIPLLEAFFLKRLDRFLTVWHRKAGKDWTWLKLIVAAMTQRPGLYCHVFPTYKQAKEVVWDGPDSQGGRFLDLIPPELIAEKSETELMIRLHPLKGKAGSIYQLLGADNLQKRRGPNATAVVLSEYQDMAPFTFEEVFEPMILANKGWAAFAFTPRGRNHAYKLWQATAGDPRWFRQLLTIQQTRKDAPGEDGSPLFPAEEIQAKRRKGDEEWLIQQEYLCSWDGVARGTIFGEALTRCRQDGRICRVPRESNMPVGCCLDIGRTDGTAIWFYQTLAREIRFIDYLAFRANMITDLSAAHYAIKRIREKPYLVTRIVLPFDAKVKGYSAVQSTEDIFREAYADTVLVDRAPVQQGHEMVRSQFSKYVFDEQKCMADQENGMPSGLESLGQYHASFDESKQEYAKEPVHDVYSHGADALRTGAMEGFTGLDWGEPEAASLAPSVVKFNPFSYGERRI